LKRLRLRMILHTLYWLFLGVAVHDFIVVAQECVADPWRWPPHAFWISLCILLLAFLALSWRDYVTAIRGALSF
jgi:hypothetical protein